MRPFNLGGILGHEPVAESGLEDREPDGNRPPEAEHDHER